jgi:fatty-acid peroxygenase
MPAIPREPGLDSTLALLEDPYHFISRRCRAHGSDVFEARPMLERTLCMSGPEAARVFYDHKRFMREGAMPRRLVSTIFGRGGVQMLDRAAHRHRKRLFRSLMTCESIGRLIALADDEWQAAAQRRACMPRVVLYDEVVRIRTRAVCAWAARHCRSRSSISARGSSRRSTTAPGRSGRLTGPRAVRTGPPTRAARR